MKLPYFFIISFFPFFLFCAQTVSADCVIFSTLKAGSRGVEVECLQQKVGAVADGRFGPLTKTAVMAWQASNRLVPDGIVGPLTRAVLNGLSTNVGNLPVAVPSIISPSSFPSLPSPVFSPAPVITSLSATTIQNGEKLTIYGKNFTNSNTVLVSPLELPDKYTDIASIDGTSLQITISTPVSEMLKDLNKDDPQIHQAVIDQIKSVNSIDGVGWYLPATISIENENGASDAVPINVNILNGV